MSNTNLCADQTKIRKIVLIPMLIVYAVIIAFASIAPTSFAEAEGAVAVFAAQSFGWLYMTVALSAVSVCLWIMCSKHGSIRLGGKNARPVMSDWTWFVVSLCGGIASGIVFWGIAEPLTHFMQPIPKFNYDPQTKEAALYALSACYLTGARRYTLFIAWRASASDFPSTI